MTPCQAPDLAMVAWRMPASVSLLAQEALTTWRARCPGAPQAPPAGREALDAVFATWYLGCRSVSGPRRRRTIEGARRRVTLIYGGYRGRPRQSTHDSASSGGRAV